jgi:hypothetical protein
MMTIKDFVKKLALLEKKTSGLSLSNTLLSVVTTIPFNSINKA